MFVKEKYRGQGLGTEFFNQLKAIAKKKCGRLEWVVLDWNEKARRFYKETIGAEEKPEWVLNRIEIKHS
jgi:RimJ/RimL family protein N-acetyltransferase